MAGADAVYCSGSLETVSFLALRTPFGGRACRSGAEPEHMDRRVPRRGQDGRRGARALRGVPRLRGRRCVRRGGRGPCLPRLPPRSAAACPGCSCGPWERGPAATRSTSSRRISLGRNPGRTEFRGTRRSTAISLPSTPGSSARARRPSPNSAKDVETGAFPRAAPYRVHGSGGAGRLPEGPARRRVSVNPARRAALDDAPYAAAADTVGGGMLSAEGLAGG